MDKRRRRSRSRPLFTVDANLFCAPFLAYILCPLGFGTLRAPAVVRRFLYSVTTQTYRTFSHVDGPGEFIRKTVGAVASFQGSSMELFQNVISCSQGVGKNKQTS